jgi:5-methylcytosine-specific restriction endonuclease McrBC regulatory subunit McrC
MNLLQITDNHDWKKIADCIPRQEQEFNLEAAKSDISLIANKQIGNLITENNPNLLVFPRDLHRYGDEISENGILSIRGDEITTGNVMGFVGINDTQLDIKSRFTKVDGEDFFLHYLLQKVFSINLFDIKHSTTQKPVFDFLLYLFPYFLKKALAQGLFKKYQRFEYNDANIKGPINVSRHIRENIPFKGTVAYSTREHSYDNDITQLIRHTIEYIKTKELGVSVLNNDKETKEGVTQIIMATQTYNSRERLQVINRNLRPIQHPYYSAYTELQKLCLQILRHESIKYGRDKDKVYGVLFDGAWLWEEYLNKVFEEHKLSITHAKNRTGENGIQLYEGGKKCYYPDFYRQVKGDAEKSFVFDAKYKRLNKDKHIDEQSGSNAISICHDDLFQMITYMYVLPAKHCALLYPLETEEHTSLTRVIKSEPRKLKGYEGEISGYGLRISTAIEMMEFWKEMKEIELDLSNQVIEDMLKQ